MKFKDGVSQILQQNIRKGACNLEAKVKRRVLIRIPSAASNRNHDGKYF